MEEAAPAQRKLCILDRIAHVIVFAFMGFWIIVIGKACIEHPIWMFGWMAVLYIFVGPTEPWGWMKETEKEDHNENS